MAITSNNPATNEMLESFTPYIKDETLFALAKAHEAYKSWRKTRFDQRKQVISKFAGQLRDRSNEFGRLITLDMGKRISESRKEVQFCAEISEFYADGAERFLADQPMGDVDANAYLHYEPQVS